MRLTKENLEFWIITNLYSEDMVYYDVINSIIEYFELNKERVIEGIRIMKEYEKTPVLMTKAIAALFNGER